MNLPPPPEGPDGDAREAADPDGDIAESHGADAYRKGLPSTANPFKDPFYREAWENGWRDAELEAKPPKRTPRSKPYTGPLAPVEVIPEPKVVRRTTPFQRPETDTQSRLWLVTEVLRLQTENARLRQVVAELEAKASTMEK